MLSHGSNPQSVVADESRQWDLESFASIRSTTKKQREREREMMTSAQFSSPLIQSRIPDMTPN